MSIVKGIFEISGSMQGTSFYKRRDSDQVIMRTKGGPNKNKIKRLPQFEGVRMQQQEWKGVTAMASVVRLTFGGLYRLADYNLTAVLNAMMNQVQKEDAERPKGERSVQLSLYRQVLEGFPFNRKHPFATILQVSMGVELHREELSATLNIPRINTEIDLNNFQRLPYFRIHLAIGSVSDMQSENKVIGYSALCPKMHGMASVASTDWLLTNGVHEPQQLVVALSERYRSVLTDEVTLVVSVAVEFGTLDYLGRPVEVKYAGCGRVIGVM